MKPTIKISISGIVFNMDSDAYSCLQNYLERIERIFAGKEGAREIIDDIEVRIAELFSARIQSPEQIITLVVVNDVIATVGSADDIAGEENEADSNTQESSRTASGTERKRLFRDIDHCTIGGVCSGLGNYFGIDRVFIRLAFSFAGLFGLLFYGSMSLVVCLIYVMLWIAVPAARSVKEKMAMRKEPITPARSSLRETEDDSEKAAHAGDFGNVLGKIIVVTCRIIVGLFLTVVAICALALLIALPIGLLTGNMILGEYAAFDLTYYIQHYTVVPLWLVIVLLTLLICLPLFAVIYIISKALFRFKTAIRFGLILLVVWLATLLTLAGIGLYVVSADSYFHDRLTEQIDHSELRERTLAPFTRLRISGNFDVTVYQSDTNYLQIEAPERIYPAIYADVADGQLSIYYKNTIDRIHKKIWIFGRHSGHLFNAYSKIRIYTTNAAALERLELSQNVRFVCDDTLTANRFTAKITGAGVAAIHVNNAYSSFEVSGAGKLAIAGRTGELEVEASGATKIDASVATDRLLFTITGISQVALSGVAANAQFNISGTAVTHAADFAVDTLAIRLSGASKMDVHVNRRLSVHASGASLVEYTGTPETEIHISGAAQVRRLEDSR
jgi:phage shock protein PspC (stress-responsive transcriptional regulator)